MPTFNTDQRLDEKGQQVVNYDLAIMESCLLNHPLFTLKKVTRLEEEYIDRKKKQAVVVIVIEVDRYRTIPSLKVLVQWMTIGSIGSKRTDETDSQNLHIRIPRRITTVVIGVRNSVGPMKQSNQNRQLIIKASIEEIRYS